MALTICSRYVVKLPVSGIAQDNIQIAQNDGVSGSTEAHKVAIPTPSRIPANALRQGNSTGGLSKRRSPSATASAWPPSPTLIADPATSISTATPAADPDLQIPQ
jgi:hypothetical protein